MSDAASEGTEPNITKGFYESLMTTREVSHDQLESYQREVLETYVDFVTGRSEFHRKRLAPLLNSGKPDFDCWPEVPILTKAELTRDYHRWRIDDIPENHGRVTLSDSSSSTSISVALPKTQMTETAIACAAFRHACGLRDGLQAASRNVAGK